MRSTGDASIEFHLHDGGTAGLTVGGESNELTVVESGGTITVTAKLECGETSCMKTDSPRRDKDLWRHLNLHQYPTATLTADKRTLQMPADNGKVNGKGTGMLNLHGVTRQISFTYHATRTGSDYEIRAFTSINIADFKIERPSFFGVHTGVKADIKVEFNLHEV